VTAATVPLAVSGKRCPSSCAEAGTAPINKSEAIAA
jgi:hypothetical protein